MKIAINCDAVPPHQQEMVGHAIFSLLRSVTGAQPAFLGFYEDDQVTVLVSPHR